MNYYPHHIGDFNSATRHLTRIERSVYRDLIELYYDTESPLLLDFNALCRLVIARSDEERTAVEQVLNEFFTQTEHGWFHARCDEEIQKYHSNRQAKSLAGKASAARRAQKTAKKPNTSASEVERQFNSEPTHVEQPLNECATNQEPITNNQEPDKEKNTAPAKRARSYSSADLVAFGVDAQVADEFLAIRKRKRAPFTAVALEGFQREAVKASMTLDAVLRKCVERGWQGFEAAWVEKDLTAGRKAPAPENFKEKAYVGTDEADIDWL